MGFKEYLNETDENIEKFMKEVELNFKKHFPNGLIKIRHSTNLSEAIICKFGMIGEVKDNVNGYYENDKMQHSFIMHKRADDTWQFKASSSKIYIKPQEGSYNAMDSIKTKMGNNSKITLDKASIKMSKFFKKLSSLMQENIDIVYGVEDIKDKYKIFK